MLESPRGTPINSLVFLGFPWFSLSPPPETLREINGKSYDDVSLARYLMPETGRVNKVFSPINE